MVSAFLMCVISFRIVGGDVVMNVSFADMALKNSFSEDIFGTNAVAP